MIFNADIFRFRYRQERNYDFWLGLTAKFPLSENSDKIRLTELAKNQTFPLFMRFLWLTIASRVFLEPSHLRTKNTNTKFATTFMNGRITIYGNIHHASLHSPTIHLRNNSYVNKLEWKRRAKNYLSSSFISVAVSLFWVELLPHELLVLRNKWCV